MNGELDASIREDQIGLVVFDALIDHVPSSPSGAEVYNPKSVREALKPLRRIVASTDVAAVGLMHPIKGNPSNFRQLVAGSHQFNAVSRSSLLLAADPEDEARRVLVRGKGNHSAAPRALEFGIKPHVFELNDHVRDADGRRRLRGNTDRKGSARESSHTGAPTREQLVPLLQAALFPARTGSEGDGRGGRPRLEGRIGEERSAVDGEPEAAARQAR